MKPPGIKNIQNEALKRAYAGFEDKENISDLKGLIPDKEYAAIADPDVEATFRTRGNPALFLSKLTSRNAPCPCGSGKQYKRCCGK